MKRNIIVGAILLASVLAPGGGALAADLVDINTADSATLQTLVGIGPTKAQAIIDYRTQNGPFTSIDQIMNVSGIGTATYAKIQAEITVSSTGSQAQSQQTTQTQSTTTQTGSTPAQTQIQTQSSGGSGPPPVTAQITTDASAVVGAGTLFAGAAFGTEASRSATCVISGTLATARPARGKKSGTPTPIRAPTTWS